MSDGEGQEQRPEVNEVDLKHLLEVLDIAISSDNPAVRDSLQKLLMVATLVTTDHSIDRIQGPLSSIYDELRNMRSRIRRLETSIESMQEKHVVDKSIGAMSGLSPTETSYWPLSDTLAQIAAGRYHNNNNKEKK